MFKITKYTLAIVTFLVLIFALMDLPSTPVMAQGKKKGGQPWRVVGNFGTDPNQDFLGTADEQPLVIRTNEFERMRVDLQGRVGIGTSAPESNLHIMNSVAAASQLSNLLTLHQRTSAEEANDGFGPGISFAIEDATSDDNEIARMRVGRDGAPNSGRLQLQTRINGGVNSNGITLRANGAVGIGNGDPIARLHVETNSTADDALVVRVFDGDTTQTQLEVASNGNVSVGLSSDNAKLNVRSHDSERHVFIARASNISPFIINNQGDVGIGTFVPTSQLHVAGETTFSFAGFGRILATTPSNFPGFIAFANNGNRREIIFDTEGMRLLTSSSDSPSPGTNGIKIDESGNVGIGIGDPSDKLSVLQDSAGRAGFFRIENSANQAAAVSAITTGRGQAVFANILNSSSDAAALFSRTSGTGPAARFERGDVELTEAGGQTTVLLQPTHQHEGGRILLRDGSADNNTTIRLDANWQDSGVGRVVTGVLQITGGSDLSERFDVKGEPRPGMVVSIDPIEEGKLVVSHKAYDRAIAGIVSGAKNIRPGMIMGASGPTAAHDFPIALSGRVYCLADTSNGEIGPGDLLTSSNKRGHCMRVTNYTRAQGAVIGKAMGRAKDGLVLVLVNLQ